MIARFGVKVLIVALCFVGCRSTDTVAVRHDLAVYQTSEMTDGVAAVRIARIRKQGIRSSGVLLAADTPSKAFAEMITSAVGCLNGGSLYLPSVQLAGLRREIVKGETDGDDLDYEAVVVYTDKKPEEMQFSGSRILNNLKGSDEYWTFVNVLLFVDSLCPAL